MKTLLNKYQNGNVKVAIFDDGTKVREWDDFQEPQPEFPESIDLKITNRCVGGGCKWCHEMSTSESNDHADLDFIKKMLEPLPGGVELAIGGGNPFDYPHLIPLLEWAKERKLVANMTVNAVHIDPFFNEINYLRDNKLIYGLGISYRGKQLMSKIKAISDCNTVIHVIAGATNEFDIQDIVSQGYKVLILGYKTVGFGREFIKNSNVPLHLRQLREFVLPMVLTKNKNIVSFDNLALRQLEVEKLVDPGVWKQHFMGADGTFTMYLDAVKKEYAVGSITTRFPVLDYDYMDITTLFSRVRELAGIE